MNAPAIPFQHLDLLLVERSLLKTTHASQCAAADASDKLRRL
jgi:hypothetical protein